MKILSTEARKLRAYIKESIQGQLRGIEQLPNKPLRVVMSVHENWKTKKGGIRKCDIENRGKFLNDSIFQALGIDDKFIVDLRYIKIQSDKEEKTVVLIEPCELNNE